MSKRSRSCAVKHSTPYGVCPVVVSGGNWVGPVQLQRSMFQSSCGFQGMAKRQLVYGELQLDRFIMLMEAAGVREMAKTTHKMLNFLDIGSGDGQLVCAHAPLRDASAGFSRAFRTFPLCHPSSSRTPPTVSRLPLLHSSLPPFPPFSIPSSLPSSFPALLPLRFILSSLHPLHTLRPTFLLLLGHGRYSQQRSSIRSCSACAAEWRLLTASLRAAKTSTSTPPLQLSHPAARSWLLCFLFCRVVSLSCLVVSCLVLPCLVVPLAVSCRVVPWCRVCRRQLQHRHGSGFRRVRSGLCATSRRARGSRWGGASCCCATSTASPPTSGR